VEAGTPTRRVDTGSGHRLDRSSPNKVLPRGCPVERTGPIPKALGELKHTHDAANLRQAVSEVLLDLARPATPRLLPPETTELPALPTRDDGPVGISMVIANLCRQSAVVSSRCQRRACPLRIIGLVLEGAPLRTVVDGTFLDDESTVRAGRFNRIRVDGATAFGTASN
jgi:hypothetical protein